MVDSPGEQQVATSEISGITTEQSGTLNNVTDDCQKFCELIMQVEGKLSLWSSIGVLMPMVVHKVKACFTRWSRCHGRSNTESC